MSTPIYHRSIDCQLFEEGEGRIRVQGRLVDNRPQGLGRFDGEPLEIHNMVIDLVVTLPGFEIVAVETHMDTHPYQLCPNVLGDYQELVGVTIARGFTKRVRELFGGPGGCSHLGALLQAMGPAAIQAGWSMVSFDDDLDQQSLDQVDPERAKRMTTNINTCHVWAEGGETMAAAKSGTSQILPGWEIERLKKLKSSPQ